MQWMKHTLNNSHSYQNPFGEAQEKAALGRGQARTPLPVGPASHTGWPRRVQFLWGQRKGWACAGLIPLCRRQLARFSLKPVGKINKARYRGHCRPDLSWVPEADPRPLLLCPPRCRDASESGTPGHPRSPSRAISTVHKRKRFAITPPAHSTPTALTRELPSTPSSHTPNSSRTAGWFDRPE